METRILATQPCKNSGATLLQIDNVLCQNLSLLWNSFKSYREAIQKVKTKTNVDFIGE
jgi:hypothetical protein